MLAVTLTDTVDTWLEQWRSYVHQLPASLNLVTTDSMRGAATAQSGGVQLSSGLSVQTVSSPSDLTGQGIAIDTQLSAFEDVSNSQSSCTTR